MEKMNLEAYCVKCKEKKEMLDSVSGWTVNGTAMTQGTCPVCGTKLTRMGKTPAHEGLEKPVIEKKASEKKTTARKTAGSKTGTARKTAVGKSVTAKKKSSSPSSVPSGARISKNQSLVIVESPAKARTVGRFLGKDYVVRASVGHVRDLLKSTLSVDIENDFTPKYRVPNDKKDIVKELTALAAGAKKVYLATDPDREGEAIAWHLLEAASIDPQKTERVVFHEITEPAINAAFANPSDVNMNLVDAQQARRVLDRLVGYQISPLLWTKVRGHLSAGRVQSVALKLVADREREIENFVAKEYWTIEAEFQPEDVTGTYTAKLVKINGKDPELDNEGSTNQHLALLKKAPFVLSSLKSGIRKRKPFAPFTTSTLQQEASKRLGFASKKTMMLAQQLYEGIDVGEEGSTGLITYMRTDSTNISEIAQAEAKKYITARYGASFAPAKPPVYSKKVKGAQEAHEAVRPTSVNRVPETIKNHLTRDQFKLYQLIWQRFVASQMSDAVYETQTVEVEAKSKNNYLFRASGSKVTFQGFLAVYEDKKDEDETIEKTENEKFPNGLAEGQKQNCKKLIPEQHFTQPPVRYTEATLVKALEEEGIGRPSTYASIMSTIEQRGYVDVRQKHLFPTEIGLTVNDLLVEHFSGIDNVGFTSLFESKLDQVAEGERDWVNVIREFYDEFEPALEKAKTAMPEVPKSAPEEVGRDCPDCGKPLVYRQGRYGRFISCSGFPACRYTEHIKEIVGNVKCPKCGGEIVVKHSRGGKTFYGCDHYPNCDWTSWRRPVSQPCPHCGGLMTYSSKNRAQCTVCNQYVPVESEES